MRHETTTLTVRKVTRIKNCHYCNNEFDLDRFSCSTPYVIKHADSCVVQIILSIKFYGYTLSIISLLYLKYDDKSRIFAGVASSFNVWLLIHIKVISKC